jgi:hypothetical protein
MDRLQKMISYRNRAELLRSMVGDFKDEEHRRKLDRVAGEYDKMADDLTVEIGAHRNTRG